MVREVPFYSNTNDDSHCVQAAFRMMLKYFLPEKEFSFEQLDLLTKKIAGKGTWWFPALIEFKEMGLQVQEIGAFDYQKYYEYGPQYLNEIYSAEVAEWYIKNSNLSHVKKYIPRFLNNVDVECRSANMADIKQLLADGWLLGIDINSRVLNERHGYTSHMVVVIGELNGNFTLHDPGLPPHENRKVSERPLSAAWSYAGRQNQSIVALKI